MNRLTAIGLASLVAYGLLIASKYTGFVSAAKDDRAIAGSAGEEPHVVIGVNPEPPQKPLSLPAPVARAELARATPAALEFRNSHDLKAYVDALMARRASLTGDERYHLAKALEECQFTTSINEDLAAYSAKQRKQFIANLPAGDALNTKRIAAYDMLDNTARCARFQGAKFNAKEIEAMFQAAAQEGDPRAQARIVVAELSKNVGKDATRTDTGTTASASANANDDLSRLIGLLETKDPEAVLIVGGFLAQNAVTSQLHVGPNGEVPEPSAFLGAFSLVACDFGPDCMQLNREPQQACAHAGYCNATTFDELYQNFLASPWSYSQAMRYRMLIHQAINTQDWGLIGLTPKLLQQ